MALKSPSYYANLAVEKYKAPEPEDISVPVAKGIQSLFKKTKKAALKPVLPGSKSLIPGLKKTGKEALLLPARVFTPGPAALTKAISTFKKTKDIKKSVVEGGKTAIEAVKDPMKFPFPELALTEEVIPIQPFEKREYGKLGYIGNVPRAVAASGIQILQGKLIFNKILPRIYKYAVKSSTDAKDVVRNIQTGIEKGRLNKNFIQKLKAKMPPEEYAKIEKAGGDLFKIVKKEPLGPLKGPKAPSAVEMPGVMRPGSPGIEISQTKPTSPLPGLTRPTPRPVVPPGVTIKTPPGLNIPAIPTSPILAGLEEPTPSKGGEVYRHYTTEEKARLIEQTEEIRAGSISKGKYEFYGKGKFGEVAFEIEAKDIPQEYLNPELTEFESAEAKEEFIDRVKSGVVDIGSIPIKKFKRVTPSKEGEITWLSKGAIAELPGEGEKIYAIDPEKIDSSKLEISKETLPKQYYKYKKKIGGGEIIAEAESSEELSKILKEKNVDVNKLFYHTGTGFFVKPSTFVEDVRVSENLAKMTNYDAEKVYKALHDIPPPVKPPGPPTNVAGYLEDIRREGDKTALPTILNNITNQVITMSRTLGAPQIYREMSDAYFYSYPKIQAALSEFRGMTKAIWKKNKIPNRISKDVYKMLEGTMPVSREVQPLKKWWDEKASELLVAINEVRTELGLEPIENVKDYMFRRVNSVAKIYLDSYRLLQGKSEIGDLPPAILNMIRFMNVKRKTIPMIFERTIDDPQAVLEFINAERKAAGQPALESLYEQDANKSIKAVLYSEILYPHLMRAISEVQRIKKNLSPEGQQWVERWLKHQVLSRPTSTDKQVNAMLAPMIKAVNVLNKSIFKKVPINLGYNPAMTLSRGIFSRFVYAGGLMMNVPIILVNALQDGHNLALAGPIAYAKAKRALYSVTWREGRALLKHSHIFQQRYPYENLDYVKQNFAEAFGRLGYRLMDLHNITTGFLSQVYRLYLNQPDFRAKVNKFKNPKLSGDRQRFAAILEAAKAGVINDELWLADYFTYVAQYPYERIGMQAIMQTSIGATAETFQTWWQNYFTGFLPEMYSRTFLGKTSLGTPVSAAERWGLLWYAMWIASAYTVGEKTGLNRVGRRVLPWRVFGRVLSPQIQMMLSLADLYSAIQTGNESLINQKSYEVRMALWTFLPAGVQLRRVMKGETRKEKLFGKQDEKPEALIGAVTKGIDWLLGKEQGPKKLY